MINLRYHIVSLVAVFLALMLGIVMGSTLLKGGVSSAQRVTSEAVRQQAESYRTQNHLLGDQVTRWQAFGAVALPVLVHDKLKGRVVVLVDTDQVDNPTRSAVQTALQDAGAAVSGRLTFASDRLTLAAGGDRSALARLLGVSATDAPALRGELIDQLTLRLATPAKLPQGKADRTRDTVTALAQRGFLADLKLADPRQQNGSAPFPSPDSLFVLIGPVGGAPTLPPDAFLVPLAGSLAGRTWALGRPLAVTAVEATGQPSDPSWIVTLRGHKEVTDRVSTVDCVDQAFGQVALVSSLARSLAGLPPGQYGIKQGTTGLLPEGTAAS